MSGQVAPGKPVVAQSLAVTQEKVRYLVKVAQDNDLSLIHI